MLCVMCVKGENHDNCVMVYVSGALWMRRKCVCLLQPYSASHVLRYVQGNSERS